MSILTYRKSLISFFAFFSLLCFAGCEHTQNADASGGNPNPAFHVKADEGVIFDSETGEVSEWKDLTGNRRDLKTQVNALNPALRISKRTLDDVGRPCIHNGFLESEGRNTTGDSYESVGFDTFSDSMKESFYRPDIFIVSAKSTESDFRLYNFFGSTDVGGIQIYALDEGLEVNSREPLPHQANSVNVLNASIEWDGLAHVRENGTELDNFTYSGSSMGRYIALFSKNVYIYEILIFQNLTEADRVKINADLMAKYGVSPKL